MTGRERVLAAARREKPDVVPAGPFVGSMAARFAGIPIGRYITDGAAIANAQFGLWLETGTDIVFTAADAYYMAEAFGVETELHADALPTAKGPALNNLREAARLEPADPHRDGRMPVYLQAAAGLADRLKSRVAIRGTGTGPFSIAGFLLGIDAFLTKLMDIECDEAEQWEEEAIHHLLEIASQTCIAFLRAQLAMGIDIAYIGDSLSSNDMISPALYRKYAFPYHRKIVQAIRPDCKRHDAVVVLHSCGNNTSILEDFADTGIDMLDVDSVVDMAVARRMVGSRLCLCGNISPVELASAAPQQVTAAVDSLVEKADIGGGFVVSTGCFVAENTPVANLKAMVQAAHAHPC